jgi:hypothetical protein
MNEKICTVCAAGICWWYLMCVFFFLAGLGWLSVCLSSSSFLPSFQVPQHHSTSIIISLLRPCCAPPIGIESSCEKAVKPALALFVAAES